MEEASQILQVAQMEYNSLSCREDATSDHTVSMPLPSPTSYEEGDYKSAGG